MINRNFFFDSVRRTLFNGKLSTGQVAGLNAILNEWDAHYEHNDDRWLAYMLATTHHETDFKMAPIEEYSKGKNKDYGKRLKMSRKPYTDTPAIFYGRGFVQLTWYENYEKAGRKLNVDLLHKPELALTLPIAAPVMFLGMMEGWFTTKKLSDYLVGDKSDWKNARRIINGLDKAEAIAFYALRYYGAISHTV